MTASSVTVCDIELTMNGKHVCKHVCKMGEGNHRVYI